MEEAFFDTPLYRGFVQFDEPPRILKRLISLRGLSNDKGKQVFSRGTRTLCSHGQT